MIQLTPHMRVLVAVEPVDFRQGIDGLVRQCRAALNADPMTGALFVFTNRGRTSVKILVYDGQGYWLCQKRLSSGRFKFWPSTAADKDVRAASLEAHELLVLLRAGDPRAINAPPDWKRLPIGQAGHGLPSPVISS
jgi:transposase